MNELRCSLVADGPSDIALLPILKWLLIEVGVVIPIQSDFADLRHLPDPPHTLHDKIRASVEWYPCDLLFIHRDAEKQSVVLRRQEIANALNQLSTSTINPSICVIPVRMTEAWLLFDEQAIRHAAGNRAGRHPLSLPELKDIEDLPDPKTTLHDLLRQASGLQGRRLRQFKAAPSVRRISDLLTDFSPLRQLAAFRALEEDIRVTITDAGWNAPRNELLS